MINVFEKSKRSIVSFVSFILFLSNASAQQSAASEKIISETVSKMSLEEKLDYLGGWNGFYIRAVPSVGLPQIKMSDGPVGVRNDKRSTAYPATVLAAASWDTAVLYKYGTSLANDSKAQGVHILLAPGVNIYRAPMNGRNFEYMGEDPFLAGSLATQYIKGLQEHGVAACVKHFAGNEQEWNRYNISSDIDERTLHELYIRPIEVAVKAADVASVMNSYNLLNGVHTSQNYHLNREILRQQWGFKGVLMSDWVSTYDALSMAKSGLDLEMPEGTHYNRDTLTALLKSGQLRMDDIDEKVKDIVRLIYRFGFDKKTQLDASIPTDNPASDSVALEIARSGIVLLKNKDNILPLSSETGTISLFGPNADVFTCGGGSGKVNPYHFVSTYQGLKKSMSGAVHKVNDAVWADISSLPIYTDTTRNQKGMQGFYYDAMNPAQAKCVFERLDTAVNFNWKNGSPNAAVAQDHFSAVWKGVIVPDEDGWYRFKVKADDGYRLKIKDIFIIDRWRDGETETSAAYYLEKGKSYPIQLDYFENAGASYVRLSALKQSSYNQKISTEARKASVAVVCVGFNYNTEYEGADRPFELPDEQIELIKTVAAANPNTVVIVNAGGAVEMASWIDQVKAVLYAWYPGQEGGTALAEIISGKINPSAKLPQTFDRKWSESPVYKSYYDDDHDGRVVYKEGLMSGYRYYASGKVKPLFPFGFGLSYTKFFYSDIKIKKLSHARYDLSFYIQNTGSRAGAEIAQLYVSYKGKKVAFPSLMLKGFTKVALQPGEKKLVHIYLDANDLSYYNVLTKAFEFVPGEYDIRIGASSEDIRLTKTYDFR